MIRLDTGWLNEVEFPKSPVNAPLSQDRYLNSRGSLSPIFSRSASTCSGLAEGPRIVLAVSPGIIEKAANVKRETRRSVIINSSTLLKM